MFPCQYKFIQLNFIWHLLQYAQARQNNWILLRFNGVEAGGSHSPQTIAPVLRNNSVIVD